MTMRQVSKQEFDVLAKYHPGEVRYYVDLNTKKTKPTSGKRRQLRRRVPATAELQAYTTDLRQCPYSEHSLIGEVHRSVMLLYRARGGKDAKIARGTIESALCKTLGQKQARIQPAVSKLLTDGWLVTAS